MRNFISRQSDYMQEQINSVRLKLIKYLLLTHVPVKYKISKTDITFFFSVRKISPKLTSVPIFLYFFCMRDTSMA